MTVKQDIPNSLCNFALENIMSIFWYLFPRMLLTQAFQCKKNHSIPSWYEESKYSGTGLKNSEKLCSQTSEDKNSYLEDNLEVKNNELSSWTIQMRLIDSLNLSTRGAKTDSVWGIYACFIEHYAKEISIRIQVRDWV